jgi:hypothetical protein
MEESEMSEGGVVVLTMVVLGSLRRLEVLSRGEPWLRAGGMDFKRIWSKFIGLRLQPLGV